MATVTINNSEQRQVDQRMVTSELINNGMFGTAKNMIIAGGIQAQRGAFRMSRKMKPGLAKAGEKLGSMADKASNTKLGKFAGRHPRATGAAVVGGATGAAAGTGAYLGMKRQQRKK